MNTTMDKRKCQASSCDALNTTSQKNKELLKIIPKQEIKQEYTEDSLSLIKNEEIDNEEYSFIVKTESLEENSVLDNFENSSVHYDVLVTPQQVQCKLCVRTFKNRFNFLIHNNEHIKVVIYPTLVDIKMNELHKCQCCDEHFNSHNNMLAHVYNVHSNKIHKSVLYNEGIKQYPVGRKKNGEEMEYRCHSCDHICKSKTALVVHTKNFHSDYGKMFKCRKLFHTPILLHEYKYKHHEDRIKAKSDDNLFLHKNGQRVPKVKEVFNIEQYQCDSCRAIFITKHLLIWHIKSSHHDFCKVYECWCGKQLRTRVLLSIHKNLQHGPIDRIIKNEKYKCAYCHKIFRTKSLLQKHIKMVHYDYGKVFECSCGKQFRTPIHLYNHNRRMHGNGKNANN